MRINISDAEHLAHDPTGQVAAVGVLTDDNKKHLLVMRLRTASKMISMLCGAGLRAQKDTNVDVARVETVDFPMPPTAIAAGIRPTGEVDLVLRFGLVGMSATLDSSSARSLAESLLRAVSEGPATRQ